MAQHKLELFIYLFYFDLASQIFISISISLYHVLHVDLFFQEISSVHWLSNIDPHTLKMHSDSVL
jgi:hypothetical protein